MGTLLLAGLTFGFSFLAASLQLDETLSNRNWELPTGLYPASLPLGPGEDLPPGSFAFTLDGMGYRVANPVRNPGEYREVESGRYYIRPLAGWAGLRDVVEETLEVRIAAGKVKSVKVFKGRTLARAVLPPARFAEIRRSDQESRRLLNYRDVPQALVKAVLAVEDRRFFEHSGVDPKGILRALAANLRTGGRGQGGSTLTQQLAKNYFLTQDKTYRRKFKEMFLALALEHRFKKEEILELYLNEIYMGQRGSVPLCGMAQAAYAFFSKDVSQLKLHEAALLAGTIQSPNALAPDRHPGAARNRRDLVLSLMKSQGLWPAAEVDAALKKDLELHLAPYLGRRTAPYFVDQVTEDLAQTFPGVALSAEGLAVETTLNLAIQRAAEAALSRGLKRLSEGSGKSLEGAVVVLEPLTGHVLALVGGRDYAASQFNRATLAQRQVGSAFKPLLFLAAFEKQKRSLQPTTKLKDEPLSLKVGGKTWEPRNSDGQFRGDVTLRQTLELSLNVPTVRLAMETGLSSIVELYRRLGVDGRLEEVPSLSLGAFEVSPLQVAGAYTAVQGRGFYAPPLSISRVTDASGNEVMVRAVQHRRVATEESAFLVRELMRGVMERGTGRSARTMGYAWPVSGKTGTTNDARDVWFVGTDAELIVVVWVGTDQGSATALTGATGALPIFVDLMKAIRKSEGPPEDPLPQGFERVVICPQSLERVAEGCSEGYAEIFFSGTAPSSLCSIHRTVIENVGEAAGNLKERLQNLFKRLEKGEKSESNSGTPSP